MPSRAQRRPVRASKRLSRRIASLTAAIECLEVRRLLSHNLTITASPTTNVTVNGGVYTADADGANVNINDLQASLNQGDVSINSGSDGTQMGVITWGPGADMTYNGPAGHTLTLQSGIGMRGGFHLLSNIAATNPFNLNINSPTAVDLFQSISDPGGNVTINASELDFSNASNTLNVGSGQVTIEPSVAGTPISIGTAMPLSSLDLDNGTLNDITAGTIQIGSATAGPVTLSAMVQHSGDANIIIVSGSSIQIPAETGWTTNQGSLSFLANQQTPVAAGNFDGILVNGTINSSGGAILLQGQGGSSGDGDGGVVIDGAGAAVTNSNGNVQILGNAGGSGLSDGVDITNGAAVSAGGSGNLTINGTGAAGAGSAGVVIGENASAPSIVSVANGSLSITGTGTGAAANRGIDLVNAAQLQVSGASSGVSLTGAGATPDAPGIFFEHGASLSSNRANVTLTGDTIDLTDFHSIASSGGNTLTLQPLSLSRNVQLGGFVDVQGALTVTVKDQTAVTFAGGANVGFASLNVGRSDGSGMLTTASSLSLGVPLTLAGGSGGVVVTNTLNPSSLTINSGGNITVGSGGVLQSGTMTLNAAGAIAPTSAGSIIGSTLVLNAGMGIGAAGAPLVTQVTATLTGRTNTGGIYITNTGSATTPLHLQGFGLPFSGLNAGAGDIQFINSGTLGLDTSVQSIRGHGNITVQTLGTTADIRVGAGTEITTTSGVTTVQAARDLTVGSSGTAMINDPSGASNVSAVLLAGRDVIVNNLGAVNAFGTGSITMTAGRNVSILHTGAANGARLTTQSGSIQLTTGAGGTFTLDADNFGPSTISTAASGPGADITISADIANLTSNDHISAGTGNVTIQPVTAGRKINLGSTTDVAAGTLELSNAELSQIVSAAVVRIGSSTASDINITAPIGLNGPSTLSLITGSTVNETNAGTLAVPQLAINAAGPVALSSANAIQLLAAQGGSSLLINNAATPLTVGLAAGISGITAANSPVEIDDDATIIAVQPINAGTATVTFAPATAGLAINIGPIVSGALSVADASLGSITAGLVQIGNPSAGTLTVSAPITTHSGFGALSLQSGGQILGFSTITIPSLSTISGQNAFLLQPNQIGIYAGQTLGSGQPISLQNAQPITISTVGPFSGISTSNAQVNITVNGNITVTSNINAGSGAITLTPTGGDVIQTAASTITGGSFTQVSGKTLSTYAGTLHTTGSGSATLNVGALAFSGNLINDSGSAVINIGTISAASPSSISGIISGAGGLTVRGAGNYTLNVSGANSYTGATSLLIGTVNLTGSLASPATVNVFSGATLTGTGSVAGPAIIGSAGTSSGSITFAAPFTVFGGTVSGKPTLLSSLTVTGGTFGGNGSVAGPTTISSGTLAPTSTSGDMNLADLSMTPATRLTVALTGPVPGFQYSQINSTGNIDLGGANLVLSGPVSSTADRYTIIQTTGTITGQFAQGAIITSAFGGKNYQIVYTAHSVIVEVSADLSIAINGPAVAAANSDVQYTVTLTNNGPSDATNVVWNESFPAGESFVSATNNAFQNGFSPSQISFTLPGMRSGETQVYTITAHVDGGVVPGSSLTSTVTASSDTRDEFPANNTASTTATVPAADLSIVSDHPTAGVEGTPVTFNVTVSNAGPFDSQNVVVSLPVADGSQFVSASQTSGPAATSTLPAPGAQGTATFAIPTLASGSSAQFSITLDPTRAAPLNFIPTVSADTGDPNLANNKFISVASIADAPITATGAANLPFVVEGQSFSGTIATINDSNPLGNGSDLGIVINWGDGRAEPGFVTQPGGAGHPMLVNASHIYRMEGGYTIQVSVIDNGGSTASASSQILVVDAPLTPHPVTFSTSPGAPFTQTVAKFTDGNSFASPFDYIAVINWGDGVVTDGLVQTDNGGGFDVVGTHTYAAVGTDPVAVTIHDFATGTVVFSTANVAPVVGTSIAVQPRAPMLSATGKNISATEGHAFSGTVGSFQYNSPTATAAAFTAKINWGDGASSAGTVVVDSAGQFHVNGTHTYATPGDYAAKFTVSLANGTSASASLKAAVADAPLIAGSPVKLSAKANASLSNIVIGSFTDTDPGNSTTPHYTGTISWGDGTTGTVKFVFNVSTKKWNVIASHTYAKKGTYALKIGVKDATATVALIGSVTVG